MSNSDGGAHQGAFFMQKEDPPTTTEEYDLDEYQCAYFDYPPGYQPTEGERLIDGFAMLNACEEDD